MATRQRARRPTTPGEMLDHEFLQPLGLTQKQFADHLGCDIKVINRIVNGARVTVNMARRFGAALGTTPQIWLALQAEVDLFDDERESPMLPGRLKGNKLRAR